MEGKDDDSSIRWENKKNKVSTEQKYRLSGNMDFKSFSARLKYQKRHFTEALWDEIIRSDNR